ncbi:hypothetical protein Tsubulata_016060, partial [Turnera subulata]
MNFLYFRCCFLYKLGMMMWICTGDPYTSMVVYSVDDVERFFKETVENRDEGIVLKDLDSKWEPGDRSGKWLKLKPEYIRAGSDLDVLIIGGYYGSGRHGGEVAQFLVGLAERSAPNAYPKRFISFCRVGTGLTDDELDAVVTKLKPYFRKYEYPKKAPPSFYQVTNNSKERPDVWIESPEKSIILSITSDIRTIRSEVFAAPYSLRFPRIDRVRYDKPWHECLDVQSFIELVHSSNGTTQKTKEDGILQDTKSRQVKSSRKGERKNVSVVPSHFLQTDVSDIKEETLIFSNMMFYFVNVPPSNSLESFHKMVAEHGGSFSMNLNNSVTHCIAAESKGIKFQAAKLHGDIIHYSWVLDCCSQKKLLPLQPKYFLFLSDTSKKKLQEEIDEFSDSYFWDLELEDVKQLLSNINTFGDAGKIDYYKKKYCPKDKWSCFHGCSIYFHCSARNLAPEWETLLGLASRRLRLEVLMGGGKISDKLRTATHLVVLSRAGSDVDFESILRSFTSEDRRLISSRRLHVVGHQWLEDSLERQQKLQEDTYNLKPYGLDQENSEELLNAQHMEEATYNSEDDVAEKKLSSFPGSEAEERISNTNFQDSRALARERDAKRKRGRPAGSSTKKAKIGGGRAQRTRARIVKKPAKIIDDESDESLSLEKADEEEIRIGEEDNEIPSQKESLLIQRTETGGDLGSLGISKAAAEKDTSRHNVSSGNAPTVEIGERLITREEWSSTAPNVNSGEKHYSQASEKPEKLEVRVDPVHAMLMDMIPSLGMKKVEDRDKSVVVDK